MLQQGKVGLGFAVGQEPLVALFASRGARILATDLAEESASSQGWILTDQHASSARSIYNPDICDPNLLSDRVEFRFLDMNAIPMDMDAQFDFVWSACAFEHLGSIDHGIAFVKNAMRLLRPGGVAVHTTEYNVSSNCETVSTGSTVLYRRRDIEKLETELTRDGHAICIDFSVGDSPKDNHVDLPPYKHDLHLKLKIDKYVATSLGLIITKGPV